MSLRGWGYEYGLLHNYIEGHSSKLKKVRTAIIRKHFSDYLLIEGLERSTRRDVTLYLRIKGFNRGFQEGVELASQSSDKIFLYNKLQRFLLKVIDIAIWKPKKVLHSSNHIFFVVVITFQHYVVCKAVDDFILRIFVFD